MRLPCIGIQAKALLQCGFGLGELAVLQQEAPSQRVGTAELGIDPNCLFDCASGVFALREPEPSQSYVKISLRISWIDGNSLLKVADAVARIRAQCCLAGLEFLAG